MNEDCGVLIVAAVTVCECVLPQAAVFLAGTRFVLLANRQTSSLLAVPDQLWNKLAVSPQHNVAHAPLTILSPLCRLTLRGDRCHVLAEISTEGMFRIPVQFKVQIFKKEKQKGRETAFKPIVSRLVKCICPKINSCNSITFA